MAPKSMKSIFDVESDASKISAKELNELTLHDILSMDSISTMKYLVQVGLFKARGGQCCDCGPDVVLTLIKVSDRNDGYKWRCPRCKKRERSIRHGSIFSGSNLDIVKAFALLYTWARDFDNQHAVWELGLSEMTVVRWYARFRAVCLFHCQTMPKIGGPGKIVEFDQTCLVHQKHHRGKEKPGTQVWYCVGVERDSGGLCFFQRVPQRDVETLDWVLGTYIADGTTLITDEWRATLNSHLRLADHQFQQFTIKHKEAYARWVDIEDPELAASLGIATNSEGHRWLRVHTNKCEGLNGILKHKLKRIRGTSLRHVDGYLAEAVFRQNARAKKYSSFLDAFVTEIALGDDFELPAEEEMEDTGEDWDLADDSEPEE